MKTEAKVRKWTFDGKSVLDERGVNACTKLNGPLIAAAPELVEALRDLVATSRRHRWHVNSDEPDVIAFAANLLARMERSEA